MALKQIRVCDFCGIELEYHETFTVRVKIGSSFDGDHTKDDFETIDLCQEHKCKYLRDINMLMRKNQHIASSDLNDSALNEEQAQAAWVLIFKNHFEKNE